MEKIFTTLRENRKLPLTDKQLSDLGVDLQHIDIRTGTTSPSVTSYFLPRANFPDVVDSPHLARSPLMQIGSHSERPGDRSHPLILESLQMCMFPDVMTDEYRYFALGKDQNRHIRDHFYGELIESPPDSVPCHDHKGHRSSLFGLHSHTKCGSDERPSSMELFAIAALTQREMRQVDQKEPDKCYFTFPQLTILMDEYGGCRIFQFSFDGKLHIQFTQVLDLGYVIAVPDWGIRYFDMIDRKDYLEKLNLLLKWAWPIPQGNPVAKVPQDLSDICMSH
ncbi:uncharacterized protein N7482_005331 [Penicillium canariense]|uniref:Uncharacterized protein n=1 Tax=Penicillium canariense TaxID=189055 RepID=A0A9W9I4Q6_9EURO|nr:uncharacterized protein N7482_005331 [Penicillium canariense]KAJ5166550.1 hypothetical protein N7482_005331 [Penicillium canariense]